MLHYIIMYNLMFVMYKFILPDIFPSMCSKWINNFISGIHSFVVVYECYNGDDFNDLRCLSIAYFIFDSFNYKFGSMFLYHHILASLLLYFISNSIDKELFITCYMYVELGNFPVYIIYAIIKSDTKINKFYYKCLLYWEFFWFIFFRIILVTYLSFYTESYLSFILNILFQCANINWSVGIYKKIRA